MKRRLGRQRPLNGTPRRLGKIVPADDPVTADAACGRLMGVEPNRIAHIRHGSKFFVNARPLHPGESSALP